MARQCTQPKRLRNAAWFKEKAMLADAQESGQIFHKEQLAFFADLGVPDSQAAQTTIPNTAAFQTEDLDAYDSDCDDVSNAKAVLMADLSNYGSDIISEVPHFKPNQTYMDVQSVHAMQGFEQTPVVDFTDNSFLKIYGKVSITDAEMNPFACPQPSNGISNDVASSRGDKVKVILVLGIRVMLLVLGETMQADRQGLLNATTVKEAGQILDEEQLAFLADPGVPDGQAVQKIIPNNAAFQTEDLDAYDSDCDDISNAKAVLMANISNYSSNVISEVPHSETYLNDMENQGVHAMQDFEQPPAVDFIDNEIHSDSNIISYSQYLQETQQENVQDTHLWAQQDTMILSVRTFEQHINIDLSSHEKMIDSQMDDMIKEKLALKEQVESLEQNLSKQIKEKECLLQTFTVFKSESKEKKDKYMENKIDLENKIKELDNILFKVGYQNPFHLKKAQWIKPTLYDGIIISNKHVAMPVIDDEETLILLSEDFGERFTPQQELDAEQAFWFRISNPTIESSNPPPVKVEVPSDLPKVSLVNASLKKLKFYLAQFEYVVKKRTIPDARTEDVLLTVTNSMYLIGESVNMDRKRKESCDKRFNLEAELLKSQNAFNDLLKSSSSSTNSEVSNDSNCCSSCFECVKDLKEQNEQLVKDLRTARVSVVSYKTGLESVEARLLVFKKNKSVYEKDIKLLKREIYLRDLDMTELKRKLELTTKEKDEVQLTLQKFENSSKNLSKLLDRQIMDKCKTGLGYNAVPPPYTGNFMSHPQNRMAAE
ncbi:hypothetical protein Tco_0607053 [Tanacetum coccineum]